MLSFPDPHGPNSVRKPYDTLSDDVTIPSDTLRKPIRRSLPGLLLMPR